MTTETSKAVADAAEAIADGCLVGRIRLLSRTINGIYDSALRPLGLTAGQLNILVVIANRAPVSPGAVAKRLNMEKSTVSRNIARMVKNGWLTVTRATSGNEQRLNLNARGSTLLVEALPRWKEAQTQTRATLGQGGAASIRTLADALWGRLGRE